MRARLSPAKKGEPWPTVLSPNPRKPLAAISCCKWRIWMRPSPSPGNVQSWITVRPSKSDQWRNNAGSGGPPNNSHRLQRSIKAVEQTFLSAGSGDILVARVWNTEHGTRNAENGHG